MLIDVIVRIYRAESRLIEATGLMRILADDNLGEPMRDIATDYALIKKFEHAEFHRRAVSIVQECRVKLRDIASTGELRNPPNVIEEFGFKEFEHVQRDVRVSHVGPMEFWKTEFGRKYFALNQAATRHGVKITRIFALTDEAARASIDILKEHEKAGVRVLIIDPSFFNEEYLLFDERILIYYERDEKDTYKLEHIVLDPPRVKKALAEFERVANHPYIKTVRDLVGNPKT